MTSKTDPNFIPPWQDKATLCRNICAGDTTVDAWVLQGILPPPRKRGGKLMWKWSEVDQYLTDGEAGKSPDPAADRIRDATRRAIEDRANH